MDRFAALVVRFDDRRLQPRADQSEHRTIGDAHLKRLEKLVVRDRIEGV
jgi:hypothetical protein